MSDLTSRAKERAYFLFASLSPRRLAARWSGPRVLANSVPKSGTNLLTQCLSLFPVLRPSFEHVTMNYNRRPGTDELAKKVNATKRGQFTSAHVFYSPENAKIVEMNEMRMILMTRDPRDVVTSHFHYVSEKHPDHRLHEHYTDLPNDHERLMASIRGVDGKHTDDGDPLESIGTWMDSFLAWETKPYVETVRFEDLIGPKGGGDRSSQERTVRRIAHHLDVSIDENDLSHIADKTYSSGSDTFRKGLIGDWKNHFTPAHVEAFKEETGDALVRLGYENDHAWGI
ncbi:sulfotransferase domain-containing protein [Haloparvum alkalitolerans]|uniref:sulfotransferase domain-containing protein n=1 Tax=Haloparvum alkalitolerans TaxID=1042953 RepID=UPI003CEF46DB